MKTCATTLLSFAAMATLSHAFVPVSSPLILQQHQSSTPVPRTINTCNAFNSHHNLLAGSDNANVRLASSSMRKYDGLTACSLSFFFPSAICFAGIGIENALINMNIQCFVFLFLFESKLNLLTSPLFSRDGSSIIIIIE